MLRSIYKKSHNRLTFYIYDRRVTKRYNVLLIWKYPISYISLIDQDLLTSELEDPKC